MAETEVICMQVGTWRWPHRPPQPAASPPAAAVTLAALSGEHQLDAYIIATDVPPDPPLQSLNAQYKCPGLCAAIVLIILENPWIFELNVTPFCVDCRESRGSFGSAAMPGMKEGKGMVLPFTSLSLTFHHLNYYVDVPKVAPSPLIQSCSNMLMRPPLIRF